MLLETTSHFQFQPIEYTNFIFLTRKVTEVDNIETFFVYLLIVYTDTNNNKKNKNIVHRSTWNLKLNGNFRKT